MQASSSPAYRPGCAASCVHAPESGVVRRWKNLKIPCWLCSCQVSPDISQFPEFNEWSSGGMGGARTMVWAAAGSGGCRPEGEGPDGVCLVCTACNTVALEISIGI
eukprot:1159673-Pelagomonas_calceolata.AAC.12